MTAAPRRRRWHVLALLGAALAAAACRGRESVAYNGPLAGDVRWAMPRIEDATGLRFKQPPKVELRSRDEVRAFIREQLTDASARDDFVGQQAAYRRLGLIPDTLDLIALLERLLGEQVVAYYHPETKTLYAPREPRLANVPVGMEQVAIRQTVAHEMVHALQDQYFNVDSALKNRELGDRAASAQAVFEGQAHLVTEWLLGARFVTWEQRRASVDQNMRAMPEVSAAPLILRETLIFPYVNGADFMGRFYDKHPKGNPLTSEAMPVSTEQVMHQEAYFGTRDAPTRVTLPAAPLGATRVYENDMGEFGTRLFVFQHTNDQRLAVRAAAGWDGDRYQVVRTPRGEGIAWLTIWDSPVDAAEFGDAMEQVITHRFDRARTERAPSGARLFHTQDRTLSVWGGEVAGRPAVLYVDVPEGARAEVVDLEKVRLEQ